MALMPVAESVLRNRRRSGKRESRMVLFHGEDSSFIEAPRQYAVRVVAGGDSLVLSGIAKRNAIFQLPEDGKNSPSKITSAGVPSVCLRGIRKRIQNFRGHLEVTSNGKGAQIRVMLATALAPCEEERSEAAA